MQNKIKTLLSCALVIALATGLAFGVVKKFPGSNPFGRAVALFQAHALARGATAPTPHTIYYTHYTAEGPDRDKSRLPVANRVPLLINMATSQSVEAHRRDGSVAESVSPTSRDAPNCCRTAPAPPL